MFKVGDKVVIIKTLETEKYFQKYWRNSNDHEVTGFDKIYIENFNCGFFWEYRFKKITRRMKLERILK